MNGIYTLVFLISHFNYLYFGLIKIIYIDYKSIYYFTNCFTKSGHFEMPSFFDQFSPVNDRNVELELNIINYFYLYLPQKLK